MHGKGSPLYAAMPCVWLARKLATTTVLERATVGHEQNFLKLGFHTAEFLNNTLTQLISQNENTCAVCVFCFAHKPTTTEVNKSLLLSPIGVHSVLITDSHSESMSEANHWKNHSIPLRRCLY